MAGNYQAVIIFFVCFSFFHTFIFFAHLSVLSVTCVLVGLDCFEETAPLVLGSPTKCVACLAVYEETPTAISVRLQSALLDRRRNFC